MLVAKRDPFHPGAHDALLSQATAAAPHTGSASRLARAMSALQIVGALLAIPVGLGSGYSMYRANFSVEATCQSLRGNIVVMLDRSVDAGTRHMLVRRDVETFENTCGTVDPDATKAFKALLAADKPLTPAVTATARRAEPQPEPVVRKVEPRSAVAVKQPAATATAPAAESEPVKRDAAASDAVWLAAVRSALLAHGGEQAVGGEQALPAQSVAAARPALTLPADRPLPRAAYSLGELPAQPPTAAAPAPAPVLPPPMSIVAVQAPQADVDHPVPPASIPEMASAPKEARSRFGELVAQIPLLGPIIEPRRN
jgi:hypothetical protein